MSGLALVCHRLGARVTGSDRADSSYVERLRRAGLKPRIGHDAAAVPAAADVVVSTAIADDNPELVRARERGQRVLHRGELLAELCATKRLLAISGTHGKTTTAAMAAWALRGIGADPAFVLGGELPGAGPDGEATNAGWGDGEWIVAEADESDASFLKLRPEVAVVTNVELDHHSHWGSKAELLDAFARFAAPSAGLVLALGCARRTRALARPRRDRGRIQGLHAFSALPAIRRGRAARGTGAACAGAPQPAQRPGRARRHRAGRVIRGRRRGTAGGLPRRPQAA